MTREKFFNRFAANDGYFTVREYRIISSGIVGDSKVI